MFEVALTLAAVLLAVAVPTWLGHRADVRRGRAGRMSCRCRETAGQYAAWNTPGDCP